MKNLSICVWQLINYAGWHYDDDNYALDLESIGAQHRLNLILPDGGSRVLMLIGNTLHGIIDAGLGKTIYSGRFI